MHGTCEYEQIIVFVGARYKHVRIHEEYGSTYIPLGPLGHSPRLEQAPSARDPFQIPTAMGMLSLSLPPIATTR